MSTVVYAPRETVYEFLLDFPGYKNYSDYVKEIDQDGDGGEGTEYGITFGWWKVTYLARSRVVGLEPPERIDWEILKDLDASGAWLVESVEPPADREVATRVTIDVQFDPDSVSAGAIDLPRFVSVSWLVEKAIPLIVKQARSVLRGVVADLEGAPRDVDLTVHETPHSVDVDEDDLDVTAPDVPDGGESESEDEGGETPAREDDGSETADTGGAADVSNRGEETGDDADAAGS